MSQRILCDISVCVIFSMIILLITLYFCQTKTAIAEGVTTTTTTTTLPDHVGYGSFSCHVGPDNTPEPNMGHSCIDHLWLSSRRPVS